MRKKLLKNALRVFFIILTIVSIWYWDGVMGNKDEHGIMQARSLYYQEKNTIDVVMMGSSHIHCDIDTGLLWKDFGIAAYDYSAAEQPLWITYHYLKEICKYQKPKVVVLDLYSPALNKEDYQYTWIRDNTMGLKFSFNKLQMLLASVEIDKLQNYFPDFVYYHDRFSELKSEDFLYPFVAHSDLAVFKGYTPRFKNEEQIEPVLDQAESGALTIKQEIYLQRIIDYTKKNDIKLFLIVAPYITNSRDELVYNRIKEIAGMNELDFNSTNYDYHLMGIDFNTDFNDESHLNYLGAAKFSTYLGKELKKLYDIPDRRGDSRYKSWELDYQRIQNEINSNCS